MKWDTVFFHNLSLATFNGLNDYYAVMELQLKTLKDNDRKEIEEEIQKLGLSDQEGFAEWDMAMQNHTATFDMMYTNFFRYSFITLIFLALEDWLYKLCLAAQDVKGVTNSPQKHSLEEYRKFLNGANISVSNRLWEVAYDLQKVRDCIVHTSGDVTRSKDEKYLRAMAKSKKGVKISNYVYSGDEEPLYLDHDMLLIQPDYCTSAIKNIKVLIEGLCDEVPLKKIDFNALFPQKSEKQPE